MYILWSVTASRPNDDIKMIEKAGFTDIAVSITFKTAYFTAYATCLRKHH